MRHFIWQSNAQKKPKLAKSHLTRTTPIMTSLTTKPLLINSKITAASIIKFTSHATLAQNTSNHNTPWNSGIQIIIIRIIILIKKVTILVQLLLLKMINPEDPMKTIGIIIENNKRKHLESHFLNNKIRWVGLMVSK
jgi:hypothetical protein